jgi:hypothetical protein
LIWLKLENGQKKEDGIREKTEFGIVIHHLFCATTPTAQEKKFGDAIFGLARVFFGEI